jgi:hypothetical protein
MMQVLQAQEKELAELERESELWLANGVAAVNQRAAAAGVPFVVVR